MKRKNTLRKAEPPNLVLQSVNPADPDVPASKSSITGNAHASERASNYIKNRYAITKAIGGLVPDNLGQGYWMCEECRTIYDTRPMAKECHHAGALRVQICVHCINTHKKRLRIGDCLCQPKN